MDALDGGELRSCNKPDSVSSGDQALFLKPIDKHVGRHQVILILTATIITHAYGQCCKFPRLGDGQNRFVTDRSSLIKLHSLHI